MEDSIIKKQMNVSDADGWYLAENAYRKWEEDFLDEDTGEIVSISRNGIIAPIGEMLTPISISLLQKNGINELFVSNKKITGIQVRYLSLWELEVISYDVILEKNKSDYYIIPKGSPLECETFFKEWAELNINGDFTIKKAVPLDFSIALFPYEDEVEQAREELKLEMYFYKIVIKSRSRSLKKIIALADNLSNIQAVIVDKFLSKDYQEWRISEIKEINIKQFFEDKINVQRYALADYNPKIKSHFLNKLDEVLDNKE
jgi:hypothetical protein